jgi:hypothetical protein
MNLVIFAVLGKTRAQFFEAVLRDDAATVSSMLSAPDSQSFINYQDAVNEGETPLQAAAGLGHSGVTELLIAARCNVDLHLSSGDTPVRVFLFLI